MNGAFDIFNKYNYRRRFFK